MSSIAKVGHKGKGICNHGAKCCPHSVTIFLTKGSGNSNVNSSSIVRKGDGVKTTCPHCGKGVVAAGASNTFCNGSPVARKGDKVKLNAGNGSITQGSPNSTAS